MSLNRSLGIVVVLGLAACRASTVAVAPEPIAVPPGPVAATPAPKPETQKEAPVSELTELVDAAENGASFARLPGGPVLLVDSMSRAIYETSPDGSIRPFAPLGTYVAEHARQFLPIGRIAGVWPAMMQMELVYMSRTEVSTESYAIDIANAKTKSLGKKTVMTAAMPWKDGRVLAFQSESGSYNAAYNGKFYVASGAPTAVPKLPKRAMFNGDFVAYPSGVVMVSAMILPADDAVAVEGEADDGGNVFLFADGVHPVAQKMPAVVSGIARGRVAEETLVYGERFVRRYDPKGWADIPLPADADIRSVLVDDDGTAWLTTGEKLYHGALPSPKWTEMKLPEDFVATDIAATTSRDLWVRGEKGNILHRGPAPAGPRFEPAASQDDWVAMMTKDAEPHPYFDGCQIPLVVLGDAADTTPAEATASTKRIGLEGHVVRGKIAGTRTIAFEPVDVEWTKGVAPSLKSALPALKKKHPHARLVCGRMVQDEEDREASATP